MILTTIEHFLETGDAILLVDLFSDGFLKAISAAYQSDSAIFSNLVQHILFITDRIVVVIALAQIRTEISHTLFVEIGDGSIDWEIGADIGACEACCSVFGRAGGRFWFRFRFRFWSRRRRWGRGRRRWGFRSTLEEAGVLVVKKFPVGIDGFVYGLMTSK